MRKAGAGSSRARARPSCWGRVRAIGCMCVLRKPRPAPLPFHHFPRPLASPVHQLHIPRFGPERHPVLSVVGHVPCPPCCPASPLLFHRLRECCVLLCTSGCLTRPDRGSREPVSPMMPLLVPSLSPVLPPIGPHIAEFRGLCCRNSIRVNLVVLLPDFAVAGL